MKTSKILGVILLLAVAAVLGVAGYVLTRPKNVPSPKPEINKIEISSDAKSIINAETKAVIFNIADTQKYLKDSGYFYNPDTFQTTNGKYEGDCFIEAALSNKKDRIVFSTGCLPGDLPQAWVGVFVNFYCPPPLVCTSMQSNNKFLIGGSGRNFVWSADDTNIIYEADLGLSGMTEQRTINSQTGEILDKKIIEGKEIPKFEDFPVTEKFQGKPAFVDLSSDPDAWEFRGVLRDGARGGPNFAGNYTVVGWGCGTECQIHAIVDAKTGNVQFFPDADGLELDFRLNSNLLIVNPPSMVEEMGLSDRSRLGGNDLLEFYYPRYYKWEDNTLKLIFSAKEETTEPKPTTARIQTPTPALQPTSTPLPTDFFSLWNTERSEKYRNEKYGFEFNFSKEFLDSEDCGVKEGNNGIIGIGDANYIYVNNNDEGLTLKALADKDIKELLKVNSVVESKKDITVGGEKAIRVVYHTREGGHTGEFVYVLHKDKIYTFSYLSSTDYCLESPVVSETDVLNYILSTFKFID